LAGRDHLSPIQPSPSRTVRAKLAINELTIGESAHVKSAAIQRKNGARRVAFPPQKKSADQVSPLSGRSFGRNKGRVGPGGGAVVQTKKRSRKRRRVITFTSEDVMAIRFGPYGDNASVKALYGEIEALGRKLESLEGSQHIRTKETRGRHRRMKPAEGRVVVQAIAQVRRKISRLTISQTGPAAARALNRIKAFFYRQVNALSPYYYQRKNVNILFREWRKRGRWYKDHAGKRTCNVTSLAMALEALGVTPNDFRGNRSLLFKIAKHHDARVRNLGEVFNWRMPDFLQLVAIYAEHQQHYRRMAAGKNRRYRRFRSSRAMEAMQAIAEAKTPAEAQKIHLTAEEANRLEFLRRRASHDVCSTIWILRRIASMLGARTRPFSIYGRAPKRSSSGLDRAAQKKLKGVVEYALKRRPVAKQKRKRDRALRRVNRYLRRIDRRLSRQLRRNRRVRYLRRESKRLESSLKKLGSLDRRIPRLKGWRRRRAEKRRKRALRWRPGWRLRWVDRRVRRRARLVSRRMRKGGARYFRYVHRRLRRYRADVRGLAPTLMAALRQRVALFQEERQIIGKIRGMVRGKAIRGPSDLAKLKPPLSSLLQKTSQDLRLDADVYRIPLRHRKRQLEGEIAPIAAQLGRMERGYQRTPGKGLAAFKDLAKTVFRPLLDTGQQIMTNPPGHWVRLQDIRGQGIVIDDPDWKGKNKLEMWLEAWRRGYFRVNLIVHK
jgi:hypothetical protein